MKGRILNTPIDNHDVVKPGQNAVNVLFTKNGRFTIMNTYNFEQTFTQ